MLEATYHILYSPCNNHLHALYHVKRLMIDDQSEPLMVSLSCLEVFWQTTCGTKASAAV